MVVERISNLHKNDPDWEHLQVGFIALNKRGVYGSYSLRPGFDFAVTDQHENSHMVQATHALGHQV
jgi:N4-(beta-N-acetylglucosaminyl)-L-asparaginase